MSGIALAIRPWSNPPRRTMMAKPIFINPPVGDLARATAFYLVEAASKAIANRTNA
jgi:hypothetical protein